jgi:hypothetical protein
LITCYLPPIKPLLFVCKYVTRSKPTNYRCERCNWSRSVRYPPVLILRKQMYEYNIYNRRKLVYFLKFSNAFKIEANTIWSLFYNKYGCWLRCTCITISISIQVSFREILWNKRVIRFNTDIYIIIFTPFIGSDYKKSFRWTEM